MDYDDWLGKMEGSIVAGNTSEWADGVDRQISVRRTLNEIKQSIISRTTCLTCKFGINLMRRMFEAGKSDEEILSRGAVMCTALKFATPRVCEGIMKLVGVSI